MKKELFEFMEMFDDADLPDGAWQQMLEDSVEQFNEAHGTKYDPLDSFLEYCELKS